MIGIVLAVATGAWKNGRGGHTGPRRLLLAMAS